MMTSMAKKKSAKRPPSREGLGYVYLPKEEYQALKLFCESQDRSASYVTKIAVREFLAKQGLWPPKPGDA